MVCILSRLLGDSELDLMTLMTPMSQAVKPGAAEAEALAMALEGAMCWDEDDEVILM